MDNKLNELYSSALFSMSKENEMVYNSFIAYQKMIADILGLTPISVKCDGNTDLYVSFSLINTIIKNHLDILNKQNLEISKNIKEHKD